MEKVRVQEAVGRILCHDITRIIPGEIEEAAFRKGHRIAPEDVEVLLSLGKDHIYVWEEAPGMVHENDAALRLAQAAAGPGVRWDPPYQGKVELKAEHPGVLRVKVEPLLAVNRIYQVTLITRRNHEAILTAGETLAGTRVIPLLIEEEKVAAAERICRNAGGVLSISPFVRRRVGVVITGNEVYYGRIQDGFAPVLRRKFERLDCEMLEPVYAPDDLERISEAIRGLVAQGAEVIAATGGMSVDPDDGTPAAIAAAGAEIVSHGTPMLPGNMHLVAYLGEIPVLGVPGGVLFKEKTAFDYLMPRLLAGERLTREDLVELAHGGMIDPGC